MRKYVAALVALVVALQGVVVVDLIFAQSKPPLPSFTLKIEDDSYDVAPTFTIDPFTGENHTQTAGYHVEIRFIDVMVVNPAFSPYTLDGHLIQMFYNVRFKGHFESWPNNPTAGSNLSPSNSESTTLKYGIGKENPDPGGFSIYIGDIPPGGMVDFQVEVIQGYITKVAGTPDLCQKITEFNTFTETGRSGWSNEQTITVDAPVTPTPTPSETSQPSTSSPPVSSSIPLQSETPETSGSQTSNSLSTSTFTAATETPSSTSKPISTATLVVLVGAAIAFVTIISIAVFLRRKYAKAK